MKKIFGSSLNKKTLTVFIMSVLFACFSSTGQTVTYDLPAGNLINWIDFFCEPDDRFNCGDNVSLTWTSTGAGTVSSAYIEFNESFYDGMSSTTALNGIADNPYGTSNNWNCFPAVYTLNLDASGYNVGGANTFTIQIDGGCLVLAKNAGWSDAYARVVVTYQSGTPTWTGTGNWTDNPNWSNSPGSTDSVVIQSGSLTVNTTTDIGDLTIENGAAVVVASGSTLTVSGNYINNGGAFTVQPGGAIVLQGELRKNGSRKMRTFGSIKVLSGSITLGN